MSTNYLRSNLGSHIWDGYRCHRVYHDHNGNLFPTGAKFVVFDEGMYIGAFSTQTEADAAFLSDAIRDNSIRLSEYKGIREELR